MSASTDRQRIDKWLWFARLAKTRTIAQKLSVSGTVRVNRLRNRSASRLVSPGDVLTIATPAGIRVLKIVAPGGRRGPATEARELYEDLSPPPEPRRPGPAAGLVDASAKRPDKRGRRAILALQRSLRDDISGDGG